MEYKSDVTIETKRLVIRTALESDANDIFSSIEKEKGYGRYYIYAHTNSFEKLSMDLREELLRAKRDERYYLSVCLKETGKVIGVLIQASKILDDKIGAEIGFAFGEEYHGMGYAKESVFAFIDFLFSLDYPAVHSFHALDNPASSHIMYKAKAYFNGENSKEYMKGYMIEDPKFCVISNKK